MSESDSAPVTLADVVHALGHYYRRGLFAAAAVAAIVGAYAILKPNTWEATQAVMLRNEAAASIDGPGKFRHDDEMKITQETLLELATSRDVLAAALAAVGRPADQRDATEAWPGPEAIAALRQRLKLAPPKGSEFGKTEVFYLKVTDAAREQAGALAGAVCDAMERAFDSLRNQRAQSLVRELEQTVDVAGRELREATARLSAMEQRAGRDLSQLRSFYQTSSNDGDLQRSLSEAQSELRLRRAAQGVNRKLLDLLHEAERDPLALVGSPGELLTSQPTLAKLKDGLVAAQLRTSDLLGNMSEEHPLVRSAMRAEKQIRLNIHNELQVATRGVEAELQLVQGRIALLEEQVATLTGRLERLAGMRAGYANLLNDFEHRQRSVEQAQRMLTAQRASAASAEVCSLLSRIGATEVGHRPQGPGRAVIAAAGVAGGLLFGFGLIFLTAPLGKRTKLVASAREILDVESDVAARAAIPQIWQPAPDDAAHRQVPLDRPAPATGEAPVPPPADTTRRPQTGGGRKRSASAARAGAVKRFLHPNWQLL